MSGLKPSEELQVSALTTALVYGIWQLNAPNLSSVKAAQPNNSTVHSSVKTAAWTSAVVTAGIALLAKSPTVFIVGGAVTVLESWKYYHGNATHPQTGAVTIPAQNGQPVQPGSSGTGPS
jgi:hypothetical protein